MPKASRCTLPIAPTFTTTTTTPEILQLLLPHPPIHPRIHVNTRKNRQKTSKKSARSRAIVHNWANIWRGTSPPFRWLLTPHSCGPHIYSLKQRTQTALCSTFKGHLHYIIIPFIIRMKMGRPRSAGGWWAEGDAS